MMPEARSQITQRSVQTAQPGTPACTELPGPAWGNSGGEPSSGPAGGGFAGSLEGDAGVSAATASSAVKARAAARIARIDAVWNSPRRIGFLFSRETSRPGRPTCLLAHRERKRAHQQVFSTTGPAARGSWFCASWNCLSLTWSSVSEEQGLISATSLPIPCDITSI
jgi:hypothetical protein